MNYNRLFRAILGFLLLPLFTVAAIVERIIPNFQPNAGFSLALDSLLGVIDAELPISRSRVRAFIDRALTHPDFSADHFDPGRMPA